MINDLVRWIAFNSGCRLIKPEDNDEYGVLEAVRFSDGNIVLLDGIQDKEFTFDCLMQHAIKYIQEQTFSNELLEFKRYKIDLNYSHKTKVWDCLVSLNGKQVAVTSSHKEITTVKLLALKFIYQMETGE
jgi:hypothetical protein